MKKILLLLIGIFLSSFGHTQVYHPFPESNAMWRCVWGASGCYDNNDYADYQYLITGDTTIGIHQYHKLERSGYFDCQPPLYPVTGYMGAFRNDIASRKVYYYPADSVSELLLYDFTLQVGDTIKGYLAETGYSGPNTAIISMIDSVELAGSYRKRWHFDASSVYWEGFYIEGIGGDKGPLEALVAQLDLNGELHCFEQNDEVLYTTDFLPACDLATGVAAEQLPNLSIHPNPVIDQLSIAPVDGSVVAEIHDMHGRSVRSMTLQPVQTTIDVAGIPAGVYTITLRSRAGDRSGRFVKLDL